MDIAVSHLVSQGHRRIGLALGPSRFVPVIRKVTGFSAAVRNQLGLDAAAVDDLIEYSLFSVEGGAAAASRLRGPRAAPRSSAGPT